MLIIDTIDLEEMSLIELFKKYKVQIVNEYNVNPEWLHDGDFYNYFYEMAFEDCIEDVILSLIHI